MGQAADRQQPAAGDEPAQHAHADRDHADRQPQRTPQVGQEVLVVRDVEQHADAQFADGGHAAVEAHPHAPVAPLGVLELGRHVARQGMGPQGLGQALAQRGEEDVTAAVEEHDAQLVVADQGAGQFGRQAIEVGRGRLGFDQIAHQLELAADLDQILLLEMAHHH